MMLSISTVNRKKEILEIVFVVLSFLLYSEGLVNLILSGGVSNTEEFIKVDFSFNKYFFFLQYCMTFAVSAVYWRQIIRLSLANWSLSLLTVIAIASRLWAVEPKPPMTNLLAIFATMLFALYLSVRFSLKEQVKLVGLFCLVSVWMSLIFCVFLQKYGISGGIHSGAWRGIWLQKNIFGRFMLLSSEILFLLIFSEKKSSRFITLSFFVAVTLLVLSNSTAAILNLAMAMALILLLGILLLPKRIMWPTFIFFSSTYALVLSLFITNAEFLLGLFGKDLSFTGRTAIWPGVMLKIQEKPIWGYGYNAFWNLLDGESAQLIRTVRWPAPGAHNGFLELTLALGIVGLSLFLISFSGTIIKAVAIIRERKNFLYLWPAVYLLFFVQANLSESALLERNNLLWLLYMTTAFSLGKHFQSRRTDIFLRPKAITQ